MSQGPGASRCPPSPQRSSGPSLSSPLDSRTLPPIQDRYHAGGARSVSQSPAARSGAMPGPATYPSTSAEGRASGPIGMHNLLNPAAAGSTETQKRARSEEVFDPPPPAFANDHRMPRASVTTSPGMVALPSITPPPLYTYPAYGGPLSRRSLVPRSPSIYPGKAPTFNGPSATIDARESPFGASKELHSVLAPDPPSLPEISTGPLSMYAYPNATTQSPQDRRPSIGSVQIHSSAERRVSGGGTSQIHMSQSDSPTTSYSSISQFSRTPPVPLPNTAANPSAGSGYFPNPPSTGPSSTYAHVDVDAKESFSPRRNVGHPYQMRFDTVEGTIQVPVDVQAASKVADEKRKRNATASHRFRERRKEKERETSQNIARLEHQVRELAEEREFYREERDYFRNLAKTMGSAQIGPRPPSPRQLRLPQLGAAGAYSKSQWPHTEDHGRNGRSTRRRTSSYAPPQGLAPPLNIAPPHLPRNNRPPNTSEVEEVNSHSRLPGPLALKIGPYDPSAPPNYDNRWKAGP